MNKLQLKNLISDALSEDIGLGDLSSAIFPAGPTSSGMFTAKEAGTLAGTEIIEAAYKLLDDNIKVSLKKQDGDAVKPGDEIASAEGSTQALLTGERVILNFVQHLSGIATATRKTVDALGSDHTRVCDTRKTLPGLRMLQKYAVRCGGGFNHRYRLDDGIMIKDNHIKAAGSIAKAVEEAKSQSGLMVKIEVETESREQVLEAIEARADIIMLDNRPPKEVAEWVKLIPDHIISEASGGITLETIGSYRDTGVDYISMGSLTHSVQALDISFNLSSP